MQMGTRIRLVIAAVALLMAVVPRASAQLLNKEAPVVVGHFHMNATSVAEHRKFWVDTLGGTPAKVGSVDVVRFPGIVLFFHQKKPSGPESRHRVRPHRVCGAGRAGADDEDRGRRLHAHQRTRAGAR